MRRHRVDDEKYQRKTKRYDSETSESSNNLSRFRLRREYEARSFGNDVGCQYEHPGRKVTRCKRKTQSHIEPNQRYVIESREMTGTDTPNFVYDDIARTSYVQRPILEDYESKYVTEEPQYMKVKKMPKYAFTKDRLNTWRHTARPIETRYFTEHFKAHKIPYAHERPALYRPEAAGRVIEARYVTDDRRVPKLIYTDVKCRAMVDASVGSATPRRKVTKIYLPEMRNRGTGSSDLSPYIAQLKAQHSPFYSSATTSCGYDSLLPLPRSDAMMTNGLPYVSKVSANPNAVTARYLIETFTQDNQIENVDNIPEKLVEKRVDGSVKVQENSKPTILDERDGHLETKMNCTPVIDVISLKQCTVDNQPPSELIKLVDLETSTHKHSRIATDIKEKVGNKISNILNIESNNLPKSDSKHVLSLAPKSESQSEVRRRFEALRKAAVDKDKTIHDNYVSQATSRISFAQQDAAVSPGLTPQLSNSNTDEEDYRFEYQYSEPSSSPKTKGRRNSLDCGRYKFRLWGHKRNEADFDKGKERTVRKKAEIQRRPLKITEPEYEVDKKKPKKLFFFSKKPKGKDRYEIRQACKQKVTAGRCDVPGVSLRIGGAHLLQQQRTKRLDTVKNAWLDKFMLGLLESTEDVHVRWNNESFENSSTTILELMDTVYQDAVFVSNSKGHQSPASVCGNEEKCVNFFQNIQAFMVHKTIYKSWKPSRSNNKFYYGNARTIARKIAVVMRANDLTMFRHSTECSNSSMDINLDLPNHFLDDASDEQVFQITDYEHLGSVSDLLTKKKLVTLETDDIAMIPTKSMNYCPKKLGDVAFKESCILQPERCEFVSLLIERSRKRYCDMQSQLKIYEEKDRQPKQKTTLQEVYRSWLDKFNWFWKDDRSSRSDSSNVHSLRQLYIIEEESSVQSKSCPTLKEYEEYQLAPKLSVINMNREAQRQDEDEKPTKTRENVAKKITDKIFSVFKKPDHEFSVKRVLPKDSIAVFKRRMKIAASLKKWQDICETTSVQSNVDKAIETQCDANDVSILLNKRKDFSEELASIHSNKTEENMKPCQEINAPIPQSDYSLASQSQTGSDQIEEETTIILPMIEAEITNKENRSAEVYCKTFDTNYASKQDFDKDLDIFRNTMKTLGTPLPDCLDCIANDNCATNDVNLYAPKYHFRPKPEKCCESSDTSDGKENLSSLRDKLNTLSETTLKSLEVLDEVDVERSPNCECSKTNMLQSDETQTEIEEGISKMTSNIVFEEPNVNDIDESEQESQQQMKNEESEDINMSVVPESQNKSEDVGGFSSSKQLNFISCGCKKPETTLHIESTDKPKDTSYTQSPSADPSCSFCNKCPTCSKVMNQVSASTSPKESLFHKNQISWHPDSSSMQQWPKTRSLASGIIHEQKGANLDGESHKEVSFKSDLDYTAPCDKKLLPSYSKNLETSASFDSRDASHQTCKEMTCPNKLPSPKYQLEDLQQEYYKDGFSGPTSQALTTPSTPKAPETFLAEKAKRPPHPWCAKKCVACIRKPWWLGGTASALPATTVPGHEGTSPHSELAGKSQDIGSTQSSGRMVKSPASYGESICRANDCNQYKVILPSLYPASTEKLVKYAKDESDDNFQGREQKQATTSVYNVIEERLDNTENLNQDYSLRDEIMHKIHKLDMPKIVEIDSNETLLIGSKRKTASTEEIRGGGTQDSIKTQRVPKTSHPSDAPNKYIAMANTNDQIEISFKVKIGPGAPENIVNSTARQRYQTHPEVYVLENREDKTETVKASNDVNIQIIIKPHSPRSEHDLTKGNPKSPNSKRYTDTSLTYSVNRSATELSIQKEEPESELKVKWPGSDGPGTSYNSDSTSKEQSGKPETIQGAIKPVNRTVASPFKVMYKTPITELDTASVGTDMEKIQIPLERDSVCLECDSDRDDLTQVNTQITIGTDSMRNYYSPSSLSAVDSNPSIPRDSNTCNGPYIERIKTLNSKPRSKMIQTYSKNESNRSCYCKTAGKPSRRFEEARPVIINTTKSQCFNCNIVNELCEDTYYEVTDTGTQYFKPPDCIMCIVKQHPKARTNFFQPLDVRMVHVQHTNPNLRKLNHGIKYDNDSSESDETDVSLSRLEVTENKSGQETLYHVPADILQSKEAKRAVLKLYTERHVSKYGEKFVTKLPKFVFDTESYINKIADKYCEEPLESNRLKSAKEK